MSFGQALYYPYINLTNKNWIKHALLFWDNISRIVPSSVEPSDSEDIIKIKYESGFINDYHPERWDTQGAFYDFSRQLRPLLESDEYYHRTFYDRKNHRRYYKDKRRFFSEMVKSEGSYIHIEKMDPDLKEYLFDLGVAVPGKNEWANWIRIDNELGFLYMTFFAKTISKNKTLPIVTDLEESFSASIYFESPINSDYNSQFEYKLGNLLIDTIVPRNINDVPIDKILEIRNKYDDERTAYFEEISNLSTSIMEINNNSALEDAINHHSKLILKETRNLEKLYNSYRIETINKFLSISIPTTITTATEYVPNEAKPFVAAGGILFGLISAANSIKKERLELNQNPKSYLLNVKSELSGDNIFKRINDTVKGIRKW